jgi:hypothetical protein
MTRGADRSSRRPAGFAFKCLYLRLIGQAVEIILDVEQLTYETASLLKAASTLIPYQRELNFDARLISIWSVPAWPNDLSRAHLFRRASGEHLKGL